MEGGGSLFCLEKMIFLEGERSNPLYLRKEYSEDREENGFVSQRQINVAKEKNNVICILQDVRIRMNIPANAAQIDVKKQWAKYRALWNSLASEIGFL